ncbi:MAG: hypothetical protein K8I60_05050 [Anaerolineae bacterium]|nr:hypothetical protein [Anaerolineae bacterium]
MTRPEDATHLLAAQRAPRTTPITEADLAPLPEPVQRYLRHTGISGRTPISAVRLKQRGELRTKPDARWMPVTAEQYFTVDPPGFHWYAHAYLGPLPLVSAHDSYVAGHGRMHIKLLSLLPMADSTGPGTDQSAMLRYLGEMCWFPTAWLSPNITWEAIDDRQARVIMTDGDHTDSGILTIDEDGRLQQYDTIRYMDQDGGTAIKRPWIGRILAEKAFHGLQIASSIEGVWVLETGEFPYVRLEVTEIEYT